jgi:hypothetical protein
MKDVSDGGTSEGGQTLFEQEEVGSWESLSPISTAVESFRQGIESKQAQASVTDWRERVTTLVSGALQMFTHILLVNSDRLLSYNWHLTLRVVF